MKDLIRKHAGPCAAAAILIVFAIIHLSDVVRGAGATANRWLIGVYVFICAVTLLFLAGFFIILNRRDIKPEKYAAICAVVLGLIYMAVLAPFSAPDEILHFISSYKISDYMMFTGAEDENGYVMIRQGDEILENIYGGSEDELRYYLGWELDQETYEVIKENLTPVFLSAEDKEMKASSVKSVSTTPLAYIPQALGITLARILGLNGILLSYMGRFFNLLFFAGIMYLVIRTIPFGKEIICGVMLLPMTLEQAASYSYDAFIISLVALFAAYCLKLAYVSREVRKKDIAILAILIAIVGPCKIVYGVVMGFALLIPVSKFGSRRNWLISAAVVLAAFIAAVLVVEGSYLGSYVTDTIDNSVGWAGEEGFTISWIIHNPVQTAKMFYETIIWQTDEWYLTMIGWEMGALDPVLNVPFLVAAGLTACLVILGIRYDGEPLYLSAGNKAWILVLTCILAAGLMVTMMVSETPASSSMVLGVQGRYFLPMLPFVIMCLKCNGVVRTGMTDGHVLFYMAVMSCYVILRLFSVVCLRVS